MRTLFNASIDFECKSYFCCKYKIHMISRRQSIRYFIALMLVILGALCLVWVVNEADTPRKIPYSNIAIGYDDQSQTNIKDHAIKVSDGKLLLAVDNPDDLKLTLEFSSTRDVSFSIKPLYPDWICQKEGQNQAYLSLSSERFNETWQLVAGKTIAFDSVVHNQESMKVSIWNDSDRKCGRAELTIERESYVSSYFIAFIVSWALIFLVSVYLNLSIVFGAIGIASNLVIVFASAELEHLAFDILINTSAWSLCLFGFLIVIHTMPLNRYVRGAVGLFLVLISLIVPVLFIGNTLLFGVAISTDAIHAVWQSNFHEIIEFFETYVASWMPIAISLLLLGLWRVLSLKASHKATGKVLLFGLVVLLSALIAIPYQLSINPIAKVIAVGSKEYFEELASYKEWKKLRKNSQPLASAKLDQNDHTLIVILGESANKNHMSLYGYPRNTTPNSDRLHSNNKLIKFSRAYASYTHTGGAVAHALTQADQYTKSSWMSAPSIISVANSLGIETTWISNQQTFGAWDNQVSILAEDAKTVLSKNKQIGTAKDADKYDGAMLPALKKVLKNSESTSLIFMHLQGSHSSYCRRFPAEHSPFENKLLRKSEFGSLASAINHGGLNCYDNSIYYTDKLLNDVVSLLREQGSAASLLYFSDHSEDVITGKAHNKDVFTYEMVEIPMVFWANEQWKNLFPNKWENLSSNSSKIFTNDHIFETLTGLLGVASSNIDSRNNVASNVFIPVEKPLTLLGRKKLYADDNWQYWQEKNAGQLSSTSACSKLLPHRANTVGKIRTSLSSGLCGFEIDVLLSDDLNDVSFSVGHGLNSLTGSNLDEVLEKVHFDKTVKIWLDIKRVTKQQIPSIISRLNYLDQKYQLKSKAIVEMSYFGEQSNLISEAGYHLSYYLPTGMVTRLEGEDESKQKDAARTLLERIESMRPSAISFDLRLYTFVKKHLEPSILSEIVYHTWFPEGLNFATPNLVEKISVKNYYRDKRIKTILAPYHSPFQY